MNNTPNLITYKIRVNRPCRLLIDDEYVRDLEANKVAVIELVAAEYLRKVIAVDNEHVFDECLLQLHDSKFDIIALPLNDLSLKTSKSNPKIKVVPAQNKSNKRKELSAQEIEALKKRRKKITQSILAYSILLLLIVATSFYIVKKTLRYEYDSSTLTATVVAKSFPYDLIGKIKIPASTMHHGKVYRVTSIDNYAFFHNKWLTSITIPNTVTSIGECAFVECTSLSSVNIPNTVTSIDGYAFYKTAWEDSQQDGVMYINNVLYRYKGEMLPNTEIKIKSGTISISDGAFSHCSNLTSITIPNSVISIGANAFSDCKSLTSITIPNSVTSIGGGAFGGCTSLTSITIPNSVKSIGDYRTFASCSALKSINLSNTLTHIGDDAFFGCKSLTSITIPNSVKSIGNDSFYGCTSLISITLPNSITTIGKGTFRECTSLASIKIPKSVISISKDAFEGTGYYNDYTNWKDGVLYLDNCLISTKGVRSWVYTIPQGIRMIATGAFHDCVGIGVLKIPESVTIIENGELVSLQYVEVDNNNKKYDSREDCNAVIETETNTLISGCRHTKIPNTIVKIGYAAFYNCSLLKSVTIPSSVISIEFDAFQKCSYLTSITLPSGITTIGDEAFAECESLSYLNIPKSIKFIAYSAFNHCNMLDTIYYGGSVKEWKSISNILESDERINKQEHGYVSPLDFTTRILKCTNGTIEL